MCVNDLNIYTIMRNNPSVYALALYLKSKQEQTVI